MLCVRPVWSFAKVFAALRGVPGHPFARRRGDAPSLAGCGPIGLLNCGVSFVLVDVFASTYTATDLLE